MALLHLNPLLSSTKQGYPVSDYPRFYVFSQTVMPRRRPTSVSANLVDRRSANYLPSVWKHEFLQTLTSEFTEERWLNQRNMLIDEVKLMMSKELMNGESNLKGVEIVDELQRLGLSYHFQDEINQILHKLNEKFDHSGDQDMDRNINNNNDDRLYVIALHFRISRQNGYHIPQEVIDEFKNEVESLSSHVCEEKTKGMLCLYEASFLAIEGESFLEEAREIAFQHLWNYLKKHSSSNDECSMIKHALELPLHWRMPRLETRWYIDNIHSTKPNTNPMFLELAKLDFNIVQSTHQQELKYVSGWWKSTGLGENLEFARDRLMANFFWSVGLGCEPNLKYLRIMSTKISSLITTMDDMYDVYGTLDELQLFTDAVERWDIDAIDSLPEYMKICFLALLNTVNDMTFNALKDHGVNVNQCLRKMWIDLCKAFLIEAKWYYTNYKPTFQEYLDNAWISVSGAVILVHAYVFASNSVTKEALECLEDYPDIIRHSSMIFRLTNDLASSSEEAGRGEVAKSVQCYMNDTGVSEHEARKYVKNLINESWKKVNETRNLNSTSLFSQSFIEITLNLARISHTVYQHRDGHTVEDHETKRRVLSLFINPT